MKMKKMLESESGTSLIEVTIAAGILIVVMAGLTGLIAFAGSVTETQGHLSARTAEYAVDKMEQLLALKFGDVQSDTRSFPAATNGGTGLAAGGDSNPTTPVALYVDYLDQAGNLLASAGIAPPANWYYKRVWKVTSVSASLKQIDVTATVALSLGGGMTPRTTVTALKTSPF
jgi:hypothetical protein